MLTTLPPNPCCRFWLAVQDLKRRPLQDVASRAQEIWQEFLAEGAPSSINLDSHSYERTSQNLKDPGRYSYEDAQVGWLSLSEGPLSLVSSCTSAYNPHKTPNPFTSSISLKHKRKERRGEEWMSVFVPGLNEAAHFVNGRFGYSFLVMQTSRASCLMSSKRASQESPGIVYGI